MAQREPSGSQRQTQEQSNNIQDVTENSNQTDNVQNDPATSPVRSERRQIRMAKFLSSSSLKHKIIKPAHCKFCRQCTNSRQEFETHLRNSGICEALYLRLEKVKGSFQK